MRSRAVTLALLVSLPLSVFRPHRAHADCPLMNGASPELAAVPVADRIGFIQDGLHVAARRARIWTYGFTAAHATMAVGQLALLPVFPKESWVDRYIGAAASAVGIVSLFAAPLHVMKDSPKLDRRIASAGPAPSETERCALLREAESLLARDADNEDRVNRWWPHVSTLTFGLAIGLLLTFGWDRAEQGALLTVASMTLGEVRLRLQPTQSLDIYRAYRRGDITGRARADSSVTWMIAPAVFPGPWQGQGQGQGPRGNPGAGLQAVIGF